MKVKSKVIVVTGGGSGVGRELALDLLSRGARVAAVDIDRSALQETVELAGESSVNLSTHVVDITDKDAVANLPEQVISRHGAVDGIINNAGIIQPFVRVNDLDYATIERVMNVNFLGTLHVAKAFLPYLLERPEAHIVNVSSMGGFLPVPGQTIYGASKAAVEQLTEGLRAELMETNVSVTVVLPGALDTRIAVNSGVDPSFESEHANLQRLLKPVAPSRAAQIIIDSMEQDRYRVLIGSDSKLMNFFHRASPKLAADSVSRVMKSLLPE